MSEESGPSPSHVVVFSTVADPDLAMKIARELVARRLAACVNVIGSTRSVYRWKGEIEEADERVLLIKTTREDFPRLVEAVRGLHAYELPEIIALPIVAGEETYLNWLTASASPLPGELP